MTADTKKRGRPEVQVADKAKNRGIRFNDYYWEKLQALGGAKWVREQLDKLPDNKNGEKNADH